MFCSGTQGAVVDGRYKLYYHKGVCELYDLREDPSELHNIASLHPGKVRALSDYLSAEMSAYQRSFQGCEYGTASVERMKQDWESIF